MAAFNSMFHRLFTIPMNLEDFENEKKGEAEILRHLLEDFKKKGLL